MNEAGTPLRAVAVHESGHTVAARALGIRVMRVSVERVYDTFYGRTRLGTTEIEVVGDIARDFSPQMTRRLRAEAVALLAGPLAERRAVSQTFSRLNFSPFDESSVDLEHATWLLSRDTPPHDLPRELRRARATAERLVRERWPAIERLAERLIRSRTLIWRAS